MMKLFFSMNSIIRSRLSNERITVETLHSSFKVARKADHKTHIPPSRLRQYDLIVIDECSQISDELFMILLKALMELPQQPIVVFVGDLSQLQPIQSRGVMAENLAEGFWRNIELDVIFRTDDPELLRFLKHVRKEQPTKETLYAFFRDRLLGADLHRAVRRLLQEACYEAKAMGKDEITPHVWLTQKAEAAKQVCYAYLKIIFNIDEDTIEESDAMYADPDAGGGKLLIREG